MLIDHAVNSILFVLSTSATLHRKRVYSIGPSIVSVRLKTKVFQKPVRQRARSFMLDTRSRAITAGKLLHTDYDRDVMRL